MLSGQWLTLKCAPCSLLPICCVLPGNESFDEYDFPPALPIMGMLDYSQDSKFAPGIQTKVTGEVLKWHCEHGLQSFPAKEYIEKLERDNQILKQQVKDVPGRVCTTCTLSCNSKVFTTQDAVFPAGFNTAICTCRWKSSPEPSQGS